MDGIDKKEEKFLTFVSLVSVLWAIILVRAKLRISPSEPVSIYFQFQLFFLLTTAQIVGLSVVEQSHFRPVMLYWDAKSETKRVDSLTMVSL